MTEQITPEEKLRFEGWCEAVGSIRASLQMYPDGGGDIGIMTEVRRLIKEALAAGFDEGYKCGRDDHQ